MVDYQSRNMDKCLFCGKNYNVGERIPRILVHCGHTFCTDCLSQLHHRQRVRCPLCRKLVKNLETVEKLPLNINILFEIVENDKLLANIQFFDDDEDDEEKLCSKHPERISHFYCSSHKTVFCRECIKLDHTDEDCFVVDLYEIEKMRKLQLKIMKYNSDQLKKRTNGDNEKCVLYKFPNKE